jgi:hypothetical protein
MAKKLTLGAIRTDGGTQVRVELDQETFLDYGRQMAAGVKFPPIDVFFDGAVYWLADGFHRYYGARESKLPTIDANVRNGTVRDAILFSIGANATHGRPRTNRDKRHAVEMLLADETWREWSDVKIAEAAAVGHSLVSNIRNELSTKEGCDLPATTLGKDGKRRRKPKSRKPKAPKPKAEPKPDAGGETSRVSSVKSKPTEQAVASVDSTSQSSRAKPEAKTEPAPEPSACDRYQQRLIEWTRKQFDNIDGLTWGHAMSVWGSLAELSGAELDAM